MARIRTLLLLLPLLAATGCDPDHPLVYAPIPPGYALAAPPEASGVPAPGAIDEARARVEAAGLLAGRLARVEAGLRDPALLRAKPEGEARGPDGSGESRAAEPPPAPAGPVDLNTATAAELDRLPRVGPAMVERIIAARPFRRVEELRRVKGVGAATYRTLAPLVTVTPTAAPR
jgi:competence protein ComEA